MPDQRTTKALASRIQIDYLKRFQPLKYWKRVVIVGSVSAALLWIFLATVLGKKEIYTPGPVSEGHRMFENKCSECHLRAWEPVSNEACLYCHADLVHQKQQVRVPRCAACHVEHRGADLTSSIGPERCAECHVDLKRKDGTKSRFASGIRRLDKGHPEFRFFKEMVIDSTAIELNHKVHMKPDLEGPKGEKVTLRCLDCHGVDETNDPQGIYRSATIRFEDHCLSCHGLGFDTDFPEAVAPHRKPEAVRAFLTSFYGRKIEEEPEIYLQEPGRRRPGPQGVRQKFSSAEEWKKIKKAEAERFLFGKVCLECHIGRHRPDELPTIAKVEMRPKYLEIGRFDHAAHRPIACSSCHAQALTSEKSSDFLVPGIQSCLQCHVSGGSAGDSCMECHRYHTPGREKVMEGRVPIKN